MDINSLIPDIYKRISNKGGWFTGELATSFSTDISRTLQVSLGDERPTGKLRMSKLGPQCPRALWYSVHMPHLAEPLQPWTELMFAYGHMVEALGLTLAKASGHEVVGEQDELNLAGITGHRDCVIDGCVVDVKSCGRYGFEKFKTGSIRSDDLFGYLDQLSGYVVASAEDPLVRVKDRGYILAIEKQLGHMVLYEHRVDADRIKRRAREYQEIVGLPSPPRCQCGTETHGEGGNIKLDVRASYNVYKHCCFPGLRKFIYSSGPVWLTHVAKLPNVPEVDTYGNIIGR